MIVTIAAAAGLPSLRFDDGLSAAFRSDYPAFKQFENYRRLFGGSGPEIAIHLTSDDFAEPGRLLAVQDFVLEVGVLESVAARMSVFSLRRKPATDDEGFPLFSLQRDSREANRQALVESVKHPLNGGSLITDDLKNLLVVVRLNDEDQNAVAAALGEIEALANATLPNAGVTHALAGIAVLRARVIQDIIRDQTVMNATGAVLGFLLCLLLFRGLIPALNAGVPAVVALVWVLGFLGHSGIGINTLTNTLPVLIMVLAFADSMHLTYKKLVGEANGFDSRDAIAEALRVTGPACFMTSLTTALAFAALLLSGSELVRSLAVAGLVAVAITFFAVILLNPLLALGAARVFREGGSRRFGVQPLLFPDAIWAGWLERILQKPNAFCLIGLVTLLVTMGLHSQIEPRFSIMENVNESALELERHRTVENLFAPLSTLDLVISNQAAAEVFSAPALRRLGDAHEALAEQFGEDRVVSMWNAAKWLDEKAPSESGGQIRRLIEVGGRTGISAFVDEDGSAYRIAVLTPEIPSQAAIKLANQVRSVVDVEAADWRIKPEITGFLEMSAVVSSRMINELNYSFLAAAAVSGIIIGLWCRRVWVGVVALIVNVLPISLAGAWLAASGRDLQFASGLALTIAFGIAVDDTVHVLNQLRPKLITGQSLTLDDLRKAFTGITPVLLATTIILVGGIGSALLSAIPTINLFAQISMGVLIAALLADVVLLPAILSFLLSKFNGRMRI